ncbi:unnamed protein product [Clonostachys rosea f. rosea IK726]|uniref:Uncharacterized protein n=1 Tax=Clonostachys rosea f. rosea IK726 TaxID=1349383 RepID=A0ACA9U053_BIOOC|nr:unnamed protein product [Clonostachys rosea f. rosea IK726]
MLNYRTRVWLDALRNVPTRPTGNAKLELAWEAFGDPFPLRSTPTSREHINQMASLKATLLCIAVGLATTSAAPVAQEFEPPGKECWSNADCYRAYFCSFPFEGKPGMCTYG